MAKMFYVNFLMVLGFSLPSWAYKGSIQFTPKEKAAHAAKIQMIVDTAAACLNDHYKAHVSFFKQNKVSMYFGNRKYCKTGSSCVRADGAPLTPLREALAAKGFDPDLEDQMVSMSCIDLSRACLAEGFAAAGQSSFWKRIDAFSQLNGKIGTILQVGLQALGWKLLYWNPDPSQNSQFTAVEKKINPENKLNFWGQHQTLYENVMDLDTYYQYHVDDKTTLVGFGTEVPQEVLNIPFYMGTAHIGYHVFLGSYGKVVEAHSSRSIYSPSNMERYPFNPLKARKPTDKFAPRATDSEVYSSGIIVVPPGYL